MSILGNENNICSYFRFKNCLPSSECCNIIYKYRSRRCLSEYTYEVLPVQFEAMYRMHLHMGKIPRMDLHLTRLEYPFMEFSPYARIYGFK